GTGVPGPVVVGAVPVVLPVGLVVLGVVGHEVAQREPVVHGDQVHRSRRPPPVVPVQVVGAGEPGGELAQADLLATPEVTHAVPVLAVPLAPQRGELADGVAVHLPD